MSNFFFDPPGTEYVVYNTMYGSYVCNKRGRVRRFKSASLALKFIRFRQLSDIYKVEAVL